MNSKTLLLGFAGLLILIGLLKPDISSFITNPSKPDVVEVIEIAEIAAPVSEGLKNKATEVIKILKSGDSDRKHDGKRLANLYMDIASLVELDGEDMVVKTTEDIRQTNRLAGTMLKLDIKNKYSKLSEAAKAVIVEAVGDDSLLLNKESRAQAVQGFRALAWACQEGAK